MRTGDLVVVRPGERLPVDGEVVCGRERGRRVDADRRVRCRCRKAAGRRVIGGTINRTGAFRYRATTLGADSVLAQIVRLMRDAQGSRAPIQDLADRISAVFVPVVIAHRARDVRRLVRRSAATAPAGARVRGGGRGADHRLPVRDGAGRADGGHGRDRRGARSWAS